ncbi:GDSL family lipase [Anoxybacillus ayderensis]|uniref:SGNH/GDSL hydrolase family protein n=1 Tax=Anoxybacillus sp. ST70 TaxID=2864180 RepID=UPI0002F5CAB0|nr:GDSL family lipase [Anoxybacillus ayderensis G10]MBW9218718.1 SGNH/GDSL hydrolase family protein [Anoxybacillus sp. ST70]THD17480.1 GDSL family lipase [Anoxybacillus ayderensis]
MSKRIIGMIVTICAATTVLWTIGLIVTIQDQFFYEASSIKQPKQTTANTKKNDALFIVALGDSLTRGTGDETGKGYVGYVVDELKKRTNQHVQFTNLAIKGQRSAQLISQLKQKEVQRQLKAADMILMTIGGNDLFRGGEALRDLSTTQLEKEKEKFVQQLRTIFQLVRTVNNDAPVFYIALYNPFNDLDNGKETSAVVRSWNYAASEVAADYQSIICVPTYDLFELQVNDYLYTDKFHPNKEGYKRIGERVASLITLTKGEE